MNDKDQVWKIGEDLAKKYSEIDSIVIKPVPLGGDDILIFVEVRTKRSNAFVSPEESINQKKLKKLYWNAEAYISNKKYKGLSRIDAICIILDVNNNIEKLEHYKGIFFVDKFIRIFY